MYINVTIMTLNYVRANMNLIKCTFEFTFTRTVAGSHQCMMKLNLLPIQGVPLFSGLKYFAQQIHKLNTQRIVCFFIGSMQVAKSQTGSSDVVVPVRSADLLHFLK